MFFREVEIHSYFHHLKAILCLVFPSMPNSRQKAALKKKEQELWDRAENKDLIKIIALIKKAGLAAQDIVKAMHGSRGRKKAATSKLAGRKVPPKYRNPADKT